MTAKKIYLAAVAAIAIIAIAVVASRPHQTEMSMPMADAPSTTQATETTSVKISNYMFEPMAIKVKVGSTVTWSNSDSVHHNIVADSPSVNAPNGPLIGKDEHYNFKFTKAGTYTYHCNPHTYMHGTIVVTN